LQNVDVVQADFGAFGNRLGVDSVRFSGCQVGIDFQSGAGG